MMQKETLMMQTKMQTKISTISTMQKQTSIISIISILSKISRRQSERLLPLTPTATVVVALYRVVAVTI